MRAINNSRVTNERRQFQRFGVKLEVMLKDSCNKEMGRVNIYDFSSLGLGVMTDLDLSVGDVLSICIDRNNDHAEIIFQGVVTWAIRNINNKCILGFKFENPSVKDLSKLYEIRTEYLEV